MIFLESKYPQHPDLKKLSIAKKFAIVLQYGVILKVNLHRSSIVKKNTNILFKLYQFLSLSPVTLSSLFFFIFYFFIIFIHSFNPSPSLVPLFPFIFFFLSIFPWIKGLMWWSSWVWCGGGFPWWWDGWLRVTVWVVGLLAWRWVMGRSCVASWVPTWIPTRQWVSLAAWFRWWLWWLWWLLLAPIGLMDCMCVA